MYNSPNDYLHSIAARAHARAARSMGMLREASDGPARLGAQDTYQHFRGISSSELASGRFTRPITVTDIETGNNDQVISVAALKGVIDRQTGEFRVIDTYEKYYTPEKTYSQSFNMAREVHGLTSNKIETLRRLQAGQGLSYGEKYDAAEAQALMNFFHGSLVVGHNVEEFDFTRLGLASRLQSEDILDTLVWAQNAGVPRGKRGLAKMFKHYTGRSMKKAGYSHHFGFHDVLSNAELLSALYMTKDIAGRDLRFIASHKGFSYGAYEGAAGTAIIKGGYYLGRGPRGLEHYMYEDEFDEHGFPKTSDRGNLEWQYDERGRRILPEGFSDTGEWDDPEELGLGAGNIFRLEAGETFRALREELQRVREASVGYTVAQRHALTRYLAGKDEDVGRSYLKGLDYNDKMIDLMMSQALPLRYDKERKRREREQRAAMGKRAKAADMIDHIYRSGGISDTQRRWLLDVNNGSSGFSARELVYRAREMKAERDERLKEIQERRLFEEGKEHKIERYEKYHYLSEADKAALRATKSFQELSEAIEDVTKKNEEQAKVLGSIASIKPYDINNLISAAHGQWSGIMGASKGVIPNFIRNPLGRIGDAAFNAIDRSVSPWNAFNRTFNAVARPLSGALLMSGNPIAMGIGAGIGGINALTQIVGNTSQAKVEMFGLSLQNNLNTLGAMISWISTPFQLLHKAIKLVTGAFGGLTFKLNNIMGSGISSMSQLGNPLEPLTGVSYLDYQKAGLMDMASLLKGGSTNAAIEELAMMQRDLYRYGKVDTDKMIAANMLGVFGEAFTPTNDAAGAYYSMANKILQRMQGASEEERANMLFYANKISPTLASTIRSADMLGITDIRQMSNPNMTGNRMYWRPLGSGEERQFRRTQFEYGVATQQFGYTKMRFADRLWNVIGRDLYNGLNELIDNLSVGNWQSAIDNAKSMWANLKDTFTKIWEGDGKTKGIGESIGAGLDKGLEKIKQWGWDIAISIIDVWNQIFRVILDKAQGVIAYLSTIKIEPTWENGKLGFNFRSIKDYKPKDTDTIFDYYRSQGEYVVTGSKEGMSEIAKMAKILFPNATDEQLAKMTVGDLKKEWVRRDASGTIGNWIYTDTSQFGITNLRYTKEDADLLMGYLGMRGANEMWGEAAAAFATPWGEHVGFDRQAAYNTTGILPLYDKATEGIMDALNTVRTGTTEGSRKLEADINVNVGDKNVGTVKVRDGGLTFSGFRSLSSVGYQKGIEVSSMQVTPGGY